MSAEPDDELINAISSDVMTCLQRSNFFNRLDDLLSPEVPSVRPRQCTGDFNLCESVLKASGFDASDISHILAVLRSRGACCDCEVLYNVSETNRFKAKYWRSQVPPDHA